MSKESELTDEQLFPSVDLAYAIAISSYETAVKRLDAIDGRLQTLLAFAVSTVVAVPTIGNARGVRFNSIWFYLALAFISAAITLGTYTRLSGTVRLLNPTKLYEGWLAFSAWEFKKNLIYFAGEDFDANTKLVARKWKMSVWITVLFFLGAVCLAVWVAPRPT